MKEQLIAIIIETVLSILATICTAVLIPKLAQLINSKTQNEVLQGVVFDLSNSAATVVNQLEQTVVSQLKIDGKWNSKTQKEVLNQAVELVMERLAEKTVATLEQNSTDVKNLVVSYIEAYLNGSHTTFPMTVDYAKAPVDVDEG